jgi:8-oxo-dGTP diphosphatase
MTILLLRHAAAGSREAWHDDDRARPLDADGVRQAAALASAFDEYGLQRIVSSPARRCVETVERLAARLGLPIEQRDELAADAPPERSLALLRELATAPVLVSTHREVIIPLIGAERACPIGSTWLLELDAVGFAPTAHLPAP